ncbi:MAG: hypothetical protein D6717_14215, partial [Gammaproteobacteria bacterium]
MSQGYLQAERLPSLVGERQCVEGADLLSAAHALAAELDPSAGGLLMLCEDRAAFAAGLLAGLISGLPLLLPPN